MPVRIFYVEGNKLIDGLELMTEHKDGAEGYQTRLAVTIWYEL